MSKELISLRLPDVLPRGLRSGLIGLAVWLWGFASVSAQQQQREWRDDFQDSSRIASFSNVTIDTDAVSGADTGRISLLTADSTLSTGSGFRIFLNGIEAGYNGPAVRSVVDVDVFAPNPDFYMATDQLTQSVFTYSISDGRLGIPINLAFTPEDAFSYNQNGSPKVLVVGSGLGGFGRVVRYDLTGGPTQEWEYNVASAALRLTGPQDVASLAGPPNNRPNEIIICDTGNDRLLLVDMTQTGDAAVQVLQGVTFRRPVDIDVVPTDAGDFLITDQGNNRVVVVQLSGNTLTTVFEYSAGLSSPQDADALSNRNILICDTGNDRLIEIARDGSLFARFESPLFGLNDADRLANSRTLVSCRNTSNQADPTLPKRLAYVTKDSVIQNIFSFGRPVDFDSLFWSGEDANTPGRQGTRLALKMRSSNNPGDFTSALPFVGPDGTPNTFYNLTRSAIHPRHDGDSLFQFQVRLETNDPLRTPVLQSIRVTSRFILFDSTGILTSTVISDSPGVVITDWSTLAFPIQVQRGDSIRVDILDANNNDARLVSFTEAEPTIPNLSTRAPVLRGKQALRLRATIKTTRTPLMVDTPLLLSWRVAYAVTPDSPSRIAFTDSLFNTVEIYKFMNNLRDRVYISVIDPSLVASAGARDSVFVTLASTLTGDSATVLLRLNPTNFSQFRGTLPAAFRTAIAGNDTLEVQDRDVLTVRYVDPDNSADVSSDSVRVIRRSFGVIRFENIDGAPVDSVDIGGQLYVRVLGETDQSLSTAQDSIQALVFVNKQGGEQETITLREVQSAPGVFDTGEFYSMQPIQVVGLPTNNNDRRLRAAGGDDIIALYQDLVARDVTQDTVAVRESVPPPPTIEGAFEIAIAPNPFRADQHADFRLAAQVRSGELTIERVEIYNLAAERVTTLPEGSILFNGNGTLTAGPRAVVSNWWNRRDGSGAPVASGTYFAKFFVRMTNQPQERFSQLIKFALIQ